MRTNYHSDQRPAYECSRRADRLTTADLPIHRRVHRGHRGHRAAAGRAQSRRDRPRPGRRRRGHRPAPADQPGRRARRRTRPLRGRPRRTRLPRRSSRRTGWSPAPWKPGGRPNSPPSPRPSRPWPRPSDTLPPLPSRVELENLAADLPGLWQAPTTSHKDRKRLLRTLIADVTLLPETDPAQARIGIRWHTGATDELGRHPAPAARPGQTQPLPGGRAGATARSDHRHPRRGRQAQRRRADHRPRAHRSTSPPCSGSATPTTSPPPPPTPHGEISVADAAQRLGCSIGVVYDWIKTGKLVARRGAGNRLCIPWTEHIEAECRQPHRRIRTPQPRSPPHQTPQRGPETAKMSVPPGTIPFNHTRPTPIRRRRSQHPIAGGAI